MPPRRADRAGSRGPTTRVRLRPGRGRAVAAQGRAERLRAPARGGGRARERSRRFEPEAIEAAVGALAAQLGVGWARSPSRCAWRSPGARRARRSARRSRSSAATRCCAGSRAVSRSNTAGCVGRFARRRPTSLAFGRARNLRSLFRALGRYASPTRQRTSSAAQSPQNSRRSAGLGHEVQRLEVRVGQDVGLAVRHVDPALLRSRARSGPCSGARPDRSTASR